MTVPNGCPLFPRQFEVLALVAKGWSTAQVAAELGISPQTVRTHLSNIYSVLGVPDRARAVLLADRENWLPFSSPVLADSTSEYTQGSQRFKREKDWRPSPAQRLYLDAFDALLKRRDLESWYAMAYARRLMCWESGACLRGGLPLSSAEDVSASVDDFLVRVARGVLRPIPLDVPEAA